MTSTPRTRRWPALTTGALGAVCLAVAAVPLAASAASAPSATAAWTASPVLGESAPNCPAGPGELTGQTVRETVSPTVDGDRVRVRLTNAFGTAPLTVGAASVARAGQGAALAAGSLHALRFSGRASVTIAPGAEVLSDWTTLTVTARRVLTLSIYVAKSDGPATIHSFANQAAFVSSAGDHTRDLGAGAYANPLFCLMLADGVDVTPASNVEGSVVALGDSITDGVQSNYNANFRWTDQLARRLDARSGRTLSVANEGISGNRLLSDAGTAGVNALARFDRDVQGQTGARTVIVLEGINDIGESTRGTTPPVSAADLIAAYRQLIARAHARGLTIVGGTLTPYKGAFYWSKDGERTREQVNRWIRTSGEFDHVIDFAAALASPDDPQEYDPRYDSGDHLHPNDAGYEAMAAAVDLPALVR